MPKKEPLPVKLVEVDSEIIAAQKAVEAELAANKLTAAAAIADKVQARADDVAIQKQAQADETAKQTKIEDAKTAAAVARRRFGEVVVLPIMLAFIAGLVTAVPGSIAAWKQAGAIQEIKQLGKDTHTLVNSNMGLQLKVNVLALQRVAELTKDPRDVKDLEDAKILLAEHQKQQKIVDERNGNKPPKGN